MVEQEWLAEVVEELYEPVRRRATSYFPGKPADADDATQEAFYKLLRSLDRYGPESNFRGLTFRIVRNVSIDLLRRRRRTVELEVEPAAEADEPVELLQQVEDKALLARALQSLRHDLRQVILLRDGEGLSSAEVSRITGLPRESIYYRLYKARRQLAELIVQLRRGQELAAFEVGPHTCVARGRPSRYPSCWRCGRPIGPA